MSSRFRDAIGLMRRHDPQIQEEGFQLLGDHAADHLDELITASGTKTMIMESGAGFWS